MESNTKTTNTYREQYGRSKCWSAASKSQTQTGTTLPNRDDPPNGTQQGRSRNAQERRSDPPKPTGDPQNRLETIMMRTHQTTKNTTGGNGTQQERKADS